MNYVNKQTSLICITTMLFFGCTQPQANDKHIAKTGTTEKTAIVKIELPKNKTGRARYHTDKDTVCIYTDPNDSLVFSKEEFNDIVDNFPELTSLHTAGPDSAYNSKIFVDLIDSSGEKKHLSFGSEAGQDNYYILYAYFLKQKNGIAKYASRRKKLRDIYRTLNSLFGALEYGGTYFGHQYYRIEGYAEFSVYWFRHYEDFFDRPYDISRQKEFYLEGLRQLIKDEVKIDNEVPGQKEKEKRCKDLFTLVDDLDKDITDNFYLRMAQSFHADHY